MLISVTVKDSKTVGQWAIPDNKGKTTIEEQKTKTVMRSAMFQRFTLPRLISSPRWSPVASLVLASRLDFQID